MAHTPLVSPNPPDWDFRDAETKEGAHVIHTYPAMMIPQVARHLIARLRVRLPDAVTLLDPFCGAGTVLVEAAAQGLLAWGNDLNPLAVRIARARTTPIPGADLDRAIAFFRDGLTLEKMTQFEGPIPEFPRRDFWFQPPVSQALAFILNQIAALPFPDLRYLAEAVFSETVRRVSNSRNREFKLYRMPPQELNSFCPDVLGEFLAHFRRYAEGLRESYPDLTRPAEPPRVVEGDSRRLSDIPDRHFDLLVTSPPYGDSRTTVAYGQFSRLSLEWLGLPQKIARGVDQTLLGGRPHQRPLPQYLPSATGSASIEQIHARDPRRAREVQAFYYDLDQTLNVLTKKLKPGALAAWVVANRTVKGVVLPTNAIITELSQAHGFVLIEDLTRNIPSKRMPRANSPSNVAGETGLTMTKEHLVTLRYEG
ncbi:DNA methyltransferase [Sulfobacillus harzensis]|uniref:site-specific DNA-methyltransferase (cytosine-N(4)-specific) n=1 Tax=Sulfobacillus harzensis TaxID=2729629 RepID=A0A7Y0Q0V5_9FIRM|nr:DNA methyltransferase [Sulfobacillus harzensis]NMP21438.1 DNA methyltransferase [Sulfobacillus harzensis]